MFKPTKPQHITNKAYVDANAGSGGGGGGSAVQGVVVEFDFYENPNNNYDKYLISKTPIRPAINAFKAGAPVVFHLPENDGGWFASDAYLSVIGYTPNGQYYVDGDPVKMEQFELSKDLQEPFNIGNLLLNESYIDDSGKYIIDIYID